MDAVKLVAFVGMPGSGKSTCVDHLVKKGHPKVYFGGEILAELKLRGLKVNEANEKLVREDVRAKEGKDAFAKRIIKKIEQLVANGEHKIVVDGIYSWSEYKVFKERFSNNAIVIAVTAPRKIRHD